MGMALTNLYVECFGEQALTLVTLVQQSSLQCLDYINTLGLAESGMDPEDPLLLWLRCGCTS